MNGTLLSLLLALYIIHSQAQSMNNEIVRRNFLQKSRCLEVENVTMEEAEAYAVHGKQQEAESNPKLKCLAACLHERSGYLFNCRVLDELFTGVPEFKEFHDLLVKCKERVDADDRCECAHQLATCIIEEKPHEFE